MHVGLVHTCMPGCVGWRAQALTNCELSGDSISCPRLRVTVRGHRHPRKLLGCLPRGSQMPLHLRLTKLGPCPFRCTPPCWVVEEAVREPVPFTRFH